MNITLKLRGAIILGVIIIFSGLMVISPAIAAPNENANPTVQGTEDPEIKRIIFVDKYRPTHAPTPGANDPVPCNNTSDNFKTIAGGIKWKQNAFPVKYYIDSSGVNGATPAAAKQVIRDSFDVLDNEEHGGGKKGIFFEETTNPSEAKITVMWSPLDGTGGTLGVASISYIPPSKQIVSVGIRFDSQDNWGIFNTISCGPQGVNSFDIGDVAVHEIVHAVGLDHVGSPADSYNTEYPSILWFGETHKVTLGAGEKLGMEFLYKAEGSSGGGDDNGGPGVKDCTTHPNSPKWCPDP